MNDYEYSFGRGCENCKSVLMEQHHLLDLVECPTCGEHHMWCFWFVYGYWFKRRNI